MANFRISYLIGNKFDRDVQYWPTITADELFALFAPPGPPPGPATPAFLRALELEHPIGMNVDQIDLMSWRVREWTMGASTWAASNVALDEPLITPDDFAVLNDSGTTPEFKFRIQRLVPMSSALRDITDERDNLAEWRNHPVIGDYFPPNRTEPMWKTLRNYGVQGVFGEAGNGSPDPALVTDNFNFTDPVVLVGEPQPYNHAKFAPASGSVSNGNIVVVAMADYVIYNTALKLFFPRLILNTLLPVFRAGRNGTSFSLLPAVPVGAAPVNPDIPCGNLTIKFGPTADDLVVPIGLIQGGGRGRDTPYTGLYPLTLEPWSVQNTRTGSFDLTMTATKFWPFLNSLNQPCYDQTSGVQTNDPFA